MNPTTLFLLQIFGPLYLLLGVAILIRTRSICRIIEAIVDNKAQLFQFGLFTFIGGLAIVLKHNLWTTPAEVIVSIFGWGAMLKGALFLLFPGIGRKVVRMYPTWLIVAGGVIAIFLGILLIWWGYFEGEQVW